jgi:hypothetical protein
MARNLGQPDQAMAPEDVALTYIHRHLEAFVENRRNFVPDNSLTSILARFGNTQNKALSSQKNCKKRVSGNSAQRSIDSWLRSHLTFSTVTHDPSC